MVRWDDRGNGQNRQPGSQERSVEVEKSQALVLRRWMANPRSFGRLTCRRALVRLPDRQPWPCNWDRSLLGGSWMEHKKKGSRAPLAGLRQALLEHVAMGRMSPPHMACSCLLSSHARIPGCFPPGSAARPPTASTRGRRSGITETQVRDELVAHRQKQVMPQGQWRREGSIEEGDRDKDANGDSPEDRGDDQASREVQLCTFWRYGKPRMYVNNHCPERV